jgi:hypothetical protein
MNVSCWIYPAVVCISPSIGTSQADPKLPFTTTVAKGEVGGKPLFIRRIEWPCIFSSRMMLRSRRADEVTG